MKTIDVVSNAIRNIGYDPDTRQLEVEYHNGRRSRFLRVPEHKYRRLINADSIGNFFNAEIRGVFQHVPLPPNLDSKAKDEEPAAG